jgi:DNA-binding NtrC family response regulator
LAEAADSESPVLISGDPGCGKELFARTIHLKSRRRFAPFIALSCRAPSEQSLERELFGDPKGSAYGVVQANTGVFKRAEGGTILLKEIECLTSALQSRLADMLERRAIVDPGEAAPISVDIRVIAASSPALEQRAAGAGFSRELYQRLSETRIVVPRLEERAEDIPLLVAHFLNGKIHARSSKPYVLCAEALELCCAYTWPGNVLELEMALEQACMVCQDGTLRRGDFPRAVQELSPPPLSNAAGHSNSRSCPAAAPNLPCSQLETAGSTSHGYTPPIDEALVPLKKFLRDQEVTYLQRTLAHVGGSKERAAELLGISLATIYRKLSEPETASEVL